MITNEQLLEAITESIRYTRRWGLKLQRPGGHLFPTPFDLSSIRWDTENRRIELDLIQNGEIVKYDLLLDQVSFHGETSITANNEELGDGEVRDS